MSSGNRQKRADLKLISARDVRKDISLARYADVKHLIQSGSLLYTWLDLETTDKDWQTAEITVASLTITDIAYNLVADNLYEVCVPDRVGLSPEAMLVTRYMASRVRDPERLSPQKAVAQIFEAVQSAPQRLWDMLGGWEDRLGTEKWQELVNEKEILVQSRSGKPKPVTVRHYPLLDDKGNIILAVRVHEPQTQRDYMEASYLADADETPDYEDQQGRWKIRQLDKYNLGFRNTFFDNRLMAAALFRANFPQKEIYALNRKSLGNHSADIFTAALSDYFFSTEGRDKLRLGSRIDPETTREKISAKLDLIMDRNTRHADPDVNIAEGVRVYDETLHNRKRGHNAPDYDNAKAIGLHRYMRDVNPGLLAHVERCGQIDYFRTFMTLDHEDGVPTTHPLRFVIVSGNDDKIYRAVPLLILGTDDQHGKFNRVWAMRADLAENDLLFEGKNILDMDAAEIANIMRLQQGQPDGIFHEIHLRRNRGVVSLEDGLKAGYAPGRSAEVFRHLRDQIIDHLDDKDRPFIGKALDAFSIRRAHTLPADHIPQPYVEEEIWTAMGDIKYSFVTMPDGTTIRLPNVIREMAQDEFKLLNDQIGDTLRSLLRPQRIEWDATPAAAAEYMELRAKKQKKLRQYQSRFQTRDVVSLPPAFYDETLDPQEDIALIDIEDVYATCLQDKLTLMDQCPSTTRSYDVEQKFQSADRHDIWQKIPFPILAAMTESQLLALKDTGRLRIRFEDNPNRPVMRFTIRYFMENGMGELLGQAHRDFYAAETAIYAGGAPYIKDPEAQRVMSAPRIAQAIERIRQNLKAGKDFVSASRPGETGAGDTYRDDFTEAILDSVEHDMLRRQKKYPQTDKRKFMFGVDPRNDRPLLQVKYEIPDRYVTVQIPDTLIDNTASHQSFGHTCLLIPKQAGLLREKHIVLEEERSGRRFYAADPVLHRLPDSQSGSFEQFYRVIAKAYGDSAQPVPEDGYILSCSELPPVAKVAEPPHPSIRISQTQLLATRNPELGGLQRGEPLTGFLIRKYDLKLKKDQKIRLRGLDQAGAETGWEAVTRVRGKPDEFTLKELLVKLDDPACHAEMDKLAFACGYGNAADLKAKALAEFTRFDEDIHHPDNVLLFFRIRDVKRISYWTPQAPRACFERKMNDPGNDPETPPKAKLARKEQFLPTNELK